MLQRERRGERSRQPGRRGRGRGRTCSSTCTDSLHSLQTSVLNGEPACAEAALYRRAGQCEYSAQVFASRICILHMFEFFHTTYNIVNLLSYRIRTSFQCLSAKFPLNLGTDGDAVSSTPPARHAWVIYM